MKIVGHLSREQLDRLVAFFDIEHGDATGFEPELWNDKDISDGFQFGFDVAGYRIFLESKDEFKSDEQFKFKWKCKMPHALFAELSLHSKEQILGILGLGGYLAENLTYDGFCFSGFYAGIHRDDNITQHQLLLILDNQGEHLVWTENLQLVPKVGDVIHLDVFEKHGLFPGRKTIQEMLESPLKFIAIAHDDLEALKDWNPMLG